MKVVLDTNIVVSGYPVERRRGCAVVTPAEFMQAWRKANQ
jgi:hypothetical protein